jgi:hypothetical protein
MTPTQCTETAEWTMRCVTYHTAVHLKRTSSRITAKLFKNKKQRYIEK